MPQRKVSTSTTAQLKYQVSSTSNDSQSQDIVPDSGTGEKKLDTLAAHQASTSNSDPGTIERIVQTLNRLSHEHQITLRLCMIGLLALLILIVISPTAEANFTALLAFLLSLVGAGAFAKLISVLTKKQPSEKPPQEA